MIKHLTPFLVAACSMVIFYTSYVFKFIYTQKMFINMQPVYCKYKNHILFKFARSLVTCFTFRFIYMRNLQKKNLQKIHNNCCHVNDSAISSVKILYEENTLFPGIIHLNFNYSLIYYSSLIATRTYQHNNWLE